MHSKILIVEDDVLSMKLETELLQAHGYDINQSIDGKNTLHLARKYHPDLIIMDVRLPEVSGLEYVKRLKDEEDLKDIPVLAVTALVMNGDEEMCLEAGCDHYISKPFSVPNFLETIAKLIK